jgi:hypothetical protein
MVVRHDTNELRAKIFRTADRIALERGVAAVAVDAVHSETGGGRRRVADYLKAWKVHQAARAAEMPDTLRVMARRLAEEAWVLSLIAHKGERSDAPPPVKSAVDEPAQVRMAEPTSTKTESREEKDRRPRPAPGHANGALKKFLKPDVWSGASNPKFAEATAKALVQAGYPLYPRELEKSDYPPSRLHNYVPAKPGRAISKALAGSRIRCWSDGSLWFEDAPRPPRPKRKHTYQRLGTALSLRRQRSPALVEKGVAFVKRSFPDSVHFNDVWEYVDPPDDFTESWLRHALRDRANQAGATFQLLGDGRYIASDHPQTDARQAGAIRRRTNR